LRLRWQSVDPDEVFFRDTSHGFLSWCVATLAGAALLGGTLSAVVGAAPGSQPPAGAEGAAAAAALWMFIALLIGAFTASYLATVGGRHRDTGPIC
jgi:hypothetical protein